MSSLPRAPATYSESDQNQLRAQIERMVGECLKRGLDMEFSTNRIILRSPDGSRFAITVADDGTLSADEL